MTVEEPRRCEVRPRSQHLFNQPIYCSGRVTVTVTARQHRTPTLAVTQRIVTCTGRGVCVLSEPVSGVAHGHTGMAPRSGGPLRLQRAAGRLTTRRNCSSWLTPILRGAARPSPSASPPITSFSCGRPARVVGRSATAWTPAGAACGPLRGCGPGSRTRRPAPGSRRAGGSSC